MNKNLALMTSSAIFFLIAVVHLVRVVLHIEIIVSGYVIPIEASVLSFAIGFALSVWMYAASRK